MLLDDAMTTLVSEIKRLRKYESAEQDRLTREQRIKDQISAIKSREEGLKMREHACTKMGETVAAERLKTKMAQDDAEKDRRLRDKAILELGVAQKALKDEQEKTATLATKVKTLTDEFVVKA